MKVVKNLIALTLALMVAMIPAFAAESSKRADFTCSSNPSNTDLALFYPTNGFVIGYYDTDSDTVTTRVSFSYTSTAVSNINNHNAQGLYAGVDIKDYENGFHAYSITSTAPNIKTDIESNTGHNFYNEAEIVIFDPLTANKTYSMTVSWYDYRQGYESSNFNVFGELSKKGVIDYNVYNNAWETLATLPYGKTAGYP